MTGARAIHRDLREIDDAARNGRFQLVFCERYFAICRLARRRLALRQRPPPRLHPRSVPPMISIETATDIAVIYRDIQAAQDLLRDVHAAIDKMKQVDIRDVFGRSHHRLELGIPSGESSRRILHVPYDLAIPIIEATIASHKARLWILNEKAKSESALAEAQASQ